MSWTQNQKLHRDRFAEYIPVFMLFGRWWSVGYWPTIAITTREINRLSRLMKPANEKIPCVVVFTKSIVPCFFPQTARMWRKITDHWTLWCVVVFVPSAAVFFCCMDFALVCCCILFFQTVPFERWNVIIWKIFSNINAFLTRKEETNENRGQGSKPIAANTQSNRSELRKAKKNIAGAPKRSKLETKGKNRVQQSALPVPCDLAPKGNDNTVKRTRRRTLNETWNILFSFLVAPCCSQGATLQVTLRCHLVVCLSVHGRTPPVLNWLPPCPLPPQYSWI